MATVNKISQTVNAPSYGFERVYWEQTIVGAGAAPPTIQAPASFAANPPGSALIAGITRTSTGVYVVTLQDAFFAVVGTGFDIDDSAGTGMYGTVGNWQNLQTSTPAAFTLRTWNASGAAPTDLPATVAGRFMFAFKKSYTGAVA
jgi:hypothetical protein